MVYEAEAKTEAKTEAKQAYRQVGITKLGWKNESPIEGGGAFLPLSHNPHFEILRLKIDGKLLKAEFLLCNSSSHADTLVPLGLMQCVRLSFLWYEPACWTVCLGDIALMSLPGAINIDE